MAREQVLSGMNLKNVSENKGTYMMDDPSIESKINSIISTLNSIEVDGETMQYILQNTGMDEQMLKQLTVSFGVNEAEEDDTYDFDEKEPSKSDMKKDSVATTANKLQKLTTKMKALAKEYKQAKESKDEAKVKKITDQLKTMTKEKKQLEKAL